jgi:hypothetical protein
MYISINHYSITNHSPIVLNFNLNRYLLVQPQFLKYLYFKDGHDLILK